jgi:flavin reductase (DIM6/NTAB) family NADH-FMN oxidoreductase RutF
MKKEVGKTLALYPTPVTLVGAMVDGKPNWMLVAHVGIIGHDRIMISAVKAHYTNKGIRENKILSVSLIDEKFLKSADRAGCTSGNKIDKSSMFDFEIGESGAPIPNDAPLTMECSVDDIYETKGFENFILKIEHTYADESALDEKGKLSLHNLKPALFSMTTYEYFSTGDFLGKCMHMND